MDPFILWLGFYLATPAATLYVVYLLSIHRANAFHKIMGEHKYFLFALLSIQIVDLFVGLFLAHKESSQSLTIEACWDLNDVEVFAFNLQCLTVLTYTFYFRKRVEDPTQSSNIQKQTLFFAGTVILAFVLSIKSGGVVCFYLLDPKEAEDFESSVLGRWPFIVEFWSVVTIPLIWYIYNDLKNSCKRNILSLLSFQIRKLKHIIILTFLRVFLRFICTLLIIFIQDINMKPEVQIANQLFSLVLTVVIVDAITHASKRGASGYIMARSTSFSLNSDVKMSEGRVELTDRHEEEENDIEEEDRWKETFKKNFTASQLQKQTTLMLASNVNICYMILIGLTDLFKRRCEGRMLLKQEETPLETTEQIKQAVFAEEVHRVRPDDFVFNHPDHAIDEFEVAKSDSVIITEFAPAIFKKIREGIISDKAIYESLIPSVNFSGIHSFQTGTGKSPSFFFFSENKVLMLKTLKASEFDILFEEGFLKNYYLYLSLNKDSLLSRYLGVFEVKINKQSPLRFLITENMLGADFMAIKRCYDLKGSLHGRLTKIGDIERFTGDSGLRVLKDQNFIEDQKDGERKVSLIEDDKETILEILKKDSQFLMDHGLIDYSIFLLIIDRQKRIGKKEGSFRSLVYDVLKQQYTMEECEQLKGNEQALQRMNTLLSRSQVSSMEATTDEDMAQPKMKKNVSNKFKKAVFRTVESLDKIKLPQKKMDDGFMDVESTDGLMRYKLGLIDFLTEYSSKKLLENNLKATYHGVDNYEISAIDPGTYQKRFMEYMTKHL